MKPIRILVFSSTFGAGHIRAAEAIIESLQKFEPTLEIIHLDFMTMISKLLNLLIRNSYIWLIKHLPKLWGKIYEKTEKIAPDSIVQRFFNTLGHKEFAQFINHVKPDVIVCTYPTIAGILAQLKRNGIFDTPLITVVTDYTAHNQWIHQGVDLYLVGCKEISEGLISRGVDPARIYISGIPVRRKFERSLARGKILSKLNLRSDLSTFLIMGGAYGVLGEKKLFHRILSDADHPVQAIIVCGKNRRLYASLDQLVKKSVNPIVRLEFVENIDELMTVADVIITKAGGLTVSEALTKSLPMLIYKPIPGQEEGNALYIQKIGAGKAIYSKEELEKTFYELILSPEKVKMLRHSAQAVAPKNSADQAAQAILKHCCYQDVEVRIEDELTFKNKFYA